MKTNIVTAALFILTLLTNGCATPTRSDETDGDTAHLNQELMAQNELRSTNGHVITSSGVATSAASTVSGDEIESVDGDEDQIAAVGSEEAARRRLLFFPAFSVRLW